MESDPKESVDGLMKLADFRMAHIVSRREHEWKVTVAFWALLAAGVAKPPTILAREYGCVLIFLLVAIVAGHTGLWIYPHWKRSKEDVDCSFRYTDQVERILSVTGKNTGLKTSTTLCAFVTDGKCLAQWLTTLILAIAVWLSSKGVWLAS